jgi:pimeloyl-ACP methyl ester carboxylesterase
MNLWKKCLAVSGLLIFVWLVASCNQPVEITPTASLVSQTPPDVTIPTSSPTSQLSSTPHAAATLTEPLILQQTASSAEPPPALSIQFETGQVTQGHDVYGTFYYYVPTMLTEKTEILVLVHGTPKDLSPEKNAEFYAASWKEFAEAHNFILIAPAFDQENFSSRYGDHAMSGYRGLFGREIGADEWVIRLVEACRQATEISNEQFYLYGHSAGGQFVSRFLVTHPETIQRAVITSAATYPQPDADIQWPFGMDQLHADIEWDEGTTNHVDILPEKKKWLAANQIHLSVIVGLNDTAELPTELIPGQKGKNRITIARNWIQDMNAFAASKGVESNFKLEFIPGVGHSMSRLLPYSQNALLSE